jgi:hypothetical protein
MNLFLKSIKINFKMSKKFENKFSVHIGHSMFAHKFLEKIEHFIWHV